MKDKLKDALSKLKPVIGFLKRYAVFVFVMLLLGIFGFFVLRINQYSRIEPSDEAVEEKLQAVQRPKVDQSALDKIQQLQDQNVQVHSLFDQARNNPFNE
ncbi:MAG TPA: hypothetical protein VM124_01490 [Candidatus Limnocylindrales bacterium]|nr:hypothetical protein [Candidatus Limnocylindrales bacterium]